MRKYIFLSFSFLFIIPSACFSQKDKKQNSRFSISAGYGLGGSFSVRGYVESLPFPSNHYRNFGNKNFVGNAQELNIGYRLGKKYELNAGIHFEHFARRVKITDTLTSVIIYLDNTIHERNYIYFANVSRLFERKKHYFRTGLGLYYIRPQSETVEYGNGVPNFYSNYESRYDT